MKNIIDGKLKVCITGDNMENIQVRELEKKCGFYIDETYIAEEDGEVLIDGELVPFKAGDILAIYGTWVKGNSDGLEYQTIVISQYRSVGYFVKKDYKKDY